MPDFIDRAKLEAAADEHLQKPGVRGDYNRREYAVRSDFMAGADAVLALLDAETTEEWGVQDSLGVTAWPTETGARITARNRTGRTLMSRRAIYTPWLPSEGGEKP